MPARPIGAHAVTDPKGNPAMAPIQFGYSLDLNWAHSNKLNCTFPYPNVCIGDHPADSKISGNEWGPVGQPKYRESLVKLIDRSPAVRLPNSLLYWEPNSGPIREDVCLNCALTVTKFVFSHSGNLGQSQIRQSLQVLP